MKPEEFKRTAAKNFKQARNKAKLSQKALGELLGIDGQAIYEYESGRANIPAHRYLFAVNLAEESATHNNRQHNESDAVLNSMVWNVAYHLAKSPRILYTRNGFADTFVELCQFLQENSTSDNNDDNSKYVEGIIDFAQKKISLKTNI